MLTQTHSGYIRYDNRLEVRSKLAEERMEMLCFLVPPNRTADAVAALKQMFDDPDGYEAVGARYEDFAAGRDRTHGWKGPPELLIVSEE